MVFSFLICSSMTLESRERLDHFGEISGVTRLNFAVNTFNDPDNSSSEAGTIAVRCTQDENKQKGNKLTHKTPTVLGEHQV